MHNEGSESEPVSACRLDKGKAHEIVAIRLFTVLPKHAVFFAATSMFQLPYIVMYICNIILNQHI